MDLWWGLCIAFMSLAILEYAFLLKVKMDLDTSVKTGVTPTSTSLSNDGKKGNNETVTEKRGRKRGVKSVGFKPWAKRIDKLFLGISLVGYFTVTLGYTMCYML